MFILISRYFWSFLSSGAPETILSYFLVLSFMDVSWICSLIRKILFFDFEFRLSSISKASINLMVSLLRFFCPGICAPYHLHWGIVACALEKFLVRIFSVLYTSIRFLFLSSVFFFFQFCSFFFVRLESCLQFFSLYLFSDHLDIFASALRY